MKQIRFAAFAALALFTLTACGVPAWWMNSHTQSIPNGYYYQGKHRPVTNSVTHPEPTRPWIVKGQRQTKVQSDSYGSAVSNHSDAGNVIINDGSVVSRSHVPKNDSKPLPSYNN